MAGKGGGPSGDVADQAFCLKSAPDWNDELMVTLRSRLIARECTKRIAVVQLCKSQSQEMKSSKFSPNR